MTNEKMSVTKEWTGGGAGVSLVLVRSAVAVIVTTVKGDFFLG